MAFGKKLLPSLRVRDRMLQYRLPEANRVKMYN